MLGAVRRIKVLESLSCSPDGLATQLCGDLLNALEPISAVSLLPHGTWQEQFPYDIYTVKYPTVKQKFKVYMDESQYKIKKKLTCECNRV